MEMLHAIRDAVLQHKADVGLGFDGDGDRCGVVDNEGNEIFADKVGVMRSIVAIERILIALNLMYVLREGKGKMGGLVDDVCFTSPFARK